MKLLRLVLILYATFCLMGAIGLFFSQKGTWSVALGIYLMINATAIAVGALFERRYKSKSSAKSGWKPTGEKFIDHNSGKIVEVHFNPKTGERNYID